MHWPEGLSARRAVAIVNGAVALTVLAVGDDLKVLYPVVVADMVDVVHMLVRFEPAAKVALHHKPMFLDHSLPSGVIDVRVAGLIQSSSLHTD